MKRNQKRKIIVIIAIIFFVFLFNTMVYGFSVGELTGTPFNNADAKNMGNIIITVLSTIGSIVSVVVLIIIGIKYMLGSVEEKAKYKSSLMPYIIGAGLLFAASTIAGILYKVAINL